MPWVCLRCPECSTLMNQLSRLLMRIPVPWVFVLAYLIGIALETALRPSSGTASPAAVGIAGAVLFAVGAVIAAWALVLFYRARTTTIPGRTSSNLVTRGPYRFSRNPMYVGLSLAYLGEAGILRQFWPIMLLPLVIAYLNWVVIPVEETRLTDSFGPAYNDYRSRVRRWL